MFGGSSLGATYLGGQPFSSGTAYTQTFNETITITDNIIKSLGKFFTDTFTLTDTFSTRSVLSRTFNEIISLTDSIEKLFNRISAGIPSLGGFIRSSLGLKPSGATAPKDKGVFVSTIVKPTSAGSKTKPDAIIRTKDKPDLR